MTCKFRFVSYSLGAAIELSDLYTGDLLMRPFLEATKHAEINGIRRPKICRQAKNKGRIPRSDQVGQMLSDMFKTNTI